MRDWYHATWTNPPIKWNKHIFTRSFMDCVVRGKLILIFDGFLRYQVITQDEARAELTLGDKCSDSEQIERNFVHVLGLQPPAQHGPGI